MKVCITGATGFIGTNLAFELGQHDNYQVFGTYNEREPHKFIKKENWIKIDLKNTIDELKNPFSGFDIVIMCAAISSGAKNIIQKPEIFVANNTLINQNTITNCVNAKVKHVIFPSCSIMYQSSKNIQDENDVNLEKISKNYIGGASMKLYAEGLCKFYSSRSNTKFSVLRHTNCIGPYDKFNPALSHVFASVIMKTNTKKETVEVWGDGSEGRDFLYITDLINLIKTLITNQKDSFELLCAGSSKIIKIKDLYSLVLQQRKIEKKLSFDISKPSIPVTICLSHEKAKNKYGWYPLVPIEEGIKKVIDWTLINKINF